MATRNIVPRATGEGSIGTSAKTWGAVYADDAAVTNNITAATFTGNLTGDVIGTASGNLPLSGGTMTGNLNFEAGISINASADNQSIGINGGTGWGKGAWMSVWGKDHATYPGFFGLHAKNDTNDYALVGKPNGSLAWNNNPVGIIGNLANGHGILTGSVSNISVAANGYKQGTVNFGQTYSSAPIVVANCSYGHAHVYVGCYSVTTTGFSYIVSNEVNTSFDNEKISWIAIG